MAFRPPRMQARAAIGAALAMVAGLALVVVMTGPRARPERPAHFALPAVVAKAQPSRAEVLRERRAVHRRDLTDNDRRDVLLLLFLNLPPH